VIVPTRNRPTALRRCLEALAAQTVADQLEIIVVDDGSRSPGGISRLVALHPRARLMRTAGCGPAAARNAGAYQARGAVLCFTDDDCAPQPDWAERLVDGLQRGADAAAGVTMSGGGALADASEIVAHAPAAVPRGDGGGLAFAPSNNLACTRTVFEAIQFDESYRGPAGEDRDWCARLRAAGYTLWPEPRASLVHHQELTLRRFLRQQFGYGSGAFRFRRRSGERRRLEPASFYIALLRSGFGHSFNVGLLVAAAQLATAAGYTVAWAAQRQNGRAVTDTSTSVAG
jgi:glycosyltransferase involved in cell wall biosynthesis